MSQDELLFLTTMMRHVTAVQEKLRRVTGELDRRSLVHDQSKFKPDEVGGFVKINKTAREHPYGSEEYREAMQSEKAEDGCITLHFARNSHHPEFHEDTSSQEYLMNLVGSHYGMGWLDLIEMVCDWAGASETYGKMTLRESLPVHRKRFDFSPEQWWLVEQVVDFLDPEDSP